MYKLLLGALLTHNKTDQDINILSDSYLIITHLQKGTYKRAPPRKITLWPFSSMESKESWKKSLVLPFTTS